MTRAQASSARIVQISRREPLDLDALIFKTAHEIAESRHLKSARLASTAWSAAQTARIGLRVSAPLTNPHDIAMRLAAIAMERDVSSVILSRIGASGLEKFGFRTEYIFGNTPQQLALCEEQMRRFWTLSLVLDAEDLAQFG